MSLQTKRPEARAEWQARVKDASRTVLPEGHWATQGRVAATLFYFPDTTMQGDIDNIVKPILDALGKHIYVDDSQASAWLFKNSSRGTSSLSRRQAQHSKMR